MMGPSHAATGAAAGFAVATAYSALTPAPTTAAELATGVLVASGAALLPDLDHPQSTATHSQGPLTRTAGWVLRALSRAAHRVSATRYDTGDGGHRHLTHTFAFCAAAGSGAALLARTWDWGALVLVWATASLAVRGALGAFRPSTRQRSLATWGAVSLAAAGAAALLVLAGGASGAYLGAFLGVGMAVHILGDALTKQAVPALWPLKLKGKRWYNIGMPPLLRFSTGSAPEKAVAWACWCVPVAGAAVLAWNGGLVLG